jgi:hypothetical protein
LDDLFDLAHQNAETMMNVEEDRAFLKLQRKKGRPGSMLGKDMILHGVEKRRERREQKMHEFRKKNEMEKKGEF